MEKIIGLSEKYYLVVGDKFELFYRGVVRLSNPYKYYVKATCEVGYTYNRYYTFTPSKNDVGSYNLEIAIYDDFGNVIDSANTTLIVNDYDAIKDDKQTILCFGDSLTYNGVWCKVGYDRLNELTNNKLTFIGKMKNGDVGYEGYGGWQWKTFTMDNLESPSSNVYVKTKHNLSDKDQHSKWESNGLIWVLESISKDELKFKRGPNNNKVNPELSSILKGLDNNSNNDVLIVDEYNYKEGNPFYNPLRNDFDISYYLKQNGFENPNLIFILLTWNGQYIPYNKDFSHFEGYIDRILSNIHLSLPSAKIGLLGIQLPCPNGGITSCYGASGYYHDWYADTITCFNYCKWLEELTKSDKYKDYVFYFDTKAQFDSEYNYHTKEEKVNSRSNKKELLGVNGIHPSMDGYLQIGDSFYRALVQMLQKNK